jgi:hypothetical protein
MTDLTVPTRQAGVPPPEHAEWGVEMASCSPLDYVRDQRFGIA